MEQREAAEAVTMPRKKKLVGKGKILPRTGHECKDVEYKYSYTLSLTSALDGVGAQHYAPAALPPARTGKPLYVHEAV